MLLSFTMAGWTYNAPDGAPTSGPQISSLAIVFTSVALLVVIMRVYVRGFMVKAFGAGKQPTIPSYTWKTLELTLILRGITR